LIDVMDGRIIIMTGDQSCWVLLLLVKNRLLSRNIHTFSLVFMLLKIFFKLLWMINRFSFVYFRRRCWWKLSRSMGDL
jgi:hypothetical protein